MELTHYMRNFTSISLSILFSLSISCKSTEKPDVSSRSPQKTKNELKIRRIPKLNLAKDELTLFEFCKKDDSCIIGFDSGDGQYLHPIDKSYEYLRISKCNDDECKVISKKQIVNKHDLPISSELLRKSQNIDLMSVLAVESIFEHVKEIKTCPVSSTPVTGDLANYTSLMLNMQSRSKVELLLGLKHYLNHPLEEDNTLEVRSLLSPSDKLSLTQEAKFRAQIFTFQSPDNKNFWYYYKKNEYGPEKNKIGLFERIKKSIIDLKHFEGGNHISLMIQRQNAKGEWEDFRYVSWPYKNSIARDLYEKESETFGTRLKKTTLPEFSQTQFANFENWLRKQPYYNWGDEATVEQLYNSRKKAKIDIGEAISELREDIKKINKTKGGSKLIKKAVRTNLQLDRLRIEIYNNITDKERSSIKKKISEGEKFLDTWFENWAPYRKLKRTPEQIAKDKILFNTYLAEEVKTEKYIETINDPEYKNEQLKKLNEHKRHLLISLFLEPTADLSIIGFNPNDPKKLLPIKEIFKKVHGIDPDDSEKWKNFIDENYEKISNVLNQSGELGTKHLGKGALKAFGYESFAKQGGIEVERHYKAYNEAMSGLYAQKKNYTGDFKITKNNCVCSVSRSLDTIYETNHFSKKKGSWTTPNQLEEIATAFAKPKKEIPHRNGHVFLGASILASAAMVSVALAKDELFNLAVKLPDAQCVASSRERYIEEMDYIFEIANTDLVAQRLLQYFLVTSPK